MTPPNESVGKGKMSYPPPEQPQVIPTQQQQQEQEQQHFSHALMPNEVPQKVTSGITPTTQHQETPLHLQPKQGGKCCGCCCDYRRAFIILAVIAIVSGIISLVTNPNNQNVNGIEDEALRKDLEEIMTDAYPTELTLAIISLVMAFVALGGAISYNQGMLGLQIIWSIINIIVGLVLGVKIANEMLALLDQYNYGFDQGGNDYTEQDKDEAFRVVKAAMIASYVAAAIFQIIWIYPSVFLILEIQKGIMSRETYPREEFSCCCLNKRNY